MDRFIKDMKGETVPGLVLCHDDGVAWQPHPEPYTYEKAYWQNYQDLKGTPIESAIVSARIDLVRKYYGDGPMLDVGIGNGAFLATRGNTMGFDVNPLAMKWLIERRNWDTRINFFDALSFWDVIEHVRSPQDYFDQIKPGAHVFFSIPVFASLHHVKQSKHYKPDEHLYYFTPEGFEKWVKRYDFELLGSSGAETRAGRQDIMSFAFQKKFPDNAAE